MFNARLTNFVISLTLLVTAGFCHTNVYASSIYPTHGVTIGEVTENSAIIWSRSNRAGFMHVDLAPVDGKKRSISIAISSADDFTGQVTFDELLPATTYNYKVWFSDRAYEDGMEHAIMGSFRSAPSSKDSAAVKLTWSGDFAGQNVCRDAKEGFPIFKTIEKEKSDLFIGLGDMIYADNICTEKGTYGNTQVPGDFIPARDLDNFWAHWRYNRADKGFQKLIASTPYFGIWDDHEVINDFGPHHDTGNKAPYIAGEKLMPLGLRAFFDYTPIAKESQNLKQLYRNIRWGKHLELFVLDNRQYRDSNLAADNKKQPKTMLGNTQLKWLKDNIKSSTATWKVIISSVPMSIPTGYPFENGRDGWGNDDENKKPTSAGHPQSDTGFERELADILTTLKANKANALFITTDVHFASVFRYTPFKSDSNYKIHEVAVGPGNAGIYPNPKFDKTLGTENLFFYGPDSFDIANWEEAKLWFNFGILEIDKKGNLTIRIKNTYGKEVYRLDLNG